jgi:hypothetical protein
VELHAFSLGGEGQRQIPHDSDASAVASLLRPSPQAAPQAAITFTAYEVVVALLMRAAAAAPAVVTPLTDGAETRAGKKQ